MSEITYLSKKILLDWYKELGVDCFMYNNPLNRLNDSRKNTCDKILDNNSSKRITPRDIARKMSDNCNTLEELEKAVTNFNDIDIKKTAKNTVFSDGNPKSDIMFIGEGPGFNEDNQGIPFCGLSGQLLDNILASIQIDRSKCYITNTVFWRTPNNRRPTKDEILICKPFLEKHISLINPRILVLVGSTAVESLLELKTAMGKLRSQIFQYKNRYLESQISTFVIFHPSYLLRQPSQKKNMWLDIQKIFHSYKKTKTE